MKWIINWINIYRLNGVTFTTIFQGIFNSTQEHIFVKSDVCGSIHQLHEFFGLIVGIRGQLPQIHEGRVPGGQAGLELCYVQERVLRRVAGVEFVDEHVFEIFEFFIRDIAG